MVNYSDFEHDDEKRFSLSQLYIWVTNRCNYRCIMCPIAGSKNKKDINKETLIRIFNDIKEPTTIVFSGGEPLLYFLDNQDLYDYLFSNEYIYPAFLTNGSLLHRNTKLLEYMNSNNWRLCFSVEGMYDNYEYIRRPGKWDDIINNISLAVNNKPKNGKLGIVEIHYIIMSKTLPDLKDFTLLMDDLGVNAVYLRNLFYSPNAEKKYGINFDELSTDQEHEAQAIKETIEELDRRNSKLFFFSEMNREFSVLTTDTDVNYYRPLEHHEVGFPSLHKIIYKDIYCHMAQCGLLIDENGIAHPCCFAGHIVLGDCNKQGIYDIFYGEAMKEIRKDMENGKRPFYCNCNLNDRCLTTSSSDVEYYDKQISLFKEKKDVDIDAAIEILNNTKTHDFNIHAVKIWNELAGAYLYRKRDFEKAEYYLHKILNIKEDSPEALMKLAYIYIERGQYQDAYNTLFLVKEEDRERYPLFFFWIGLLSERTKKIGEMIDNYERFVQKFNDKDSWGYKHALKKLSEVSKNDIG